MTRGLPRRAVLQLSHSRCAAVHAPAPKRRVGVTIDLASNTAPATCHKLDQGKNRSFVIQTGGRASPSRQLSLIPYHNLCRTNLHAFLNMIQRTSTNVLTGFP